MDKPESFEIQEYGDQPTAYETIKVVKQIAQDYRDSNPVTSHAVKFDFIGNSLKVTIALFEMHLPSRMKIVEDMAFQYQKSCVSHLKKEFKKRTKRDLGLKEDKDKSGYHTEKVSLNERYYYVCWYFYNLDF